METAILVAIITVAGSIIVASITFNLTKKHELKLEWLREKREHYKNLLQALSDLAIDGIDKEEANKRFSSYANTIALVAPQFVITALMNFHNEIKFSNPNKTTENHDKLLKELLIAIRKDLELSKDDEIDSFVFHLIGSKPK